MKIPKIQNSWIFGGFICFLFSIYLVSFGRFTPGQNMKFMSYETPPLFVDLWERNQDHKYLSPGIPAFVVIKDVTSRPS